MVPPAPPAPAPSDEFHKQSFTQHLSMMVGSAIVTGQDKGHKTSAEVAATSQFPHPWRRGSHSNVYRYQARSGACTRQS
jgi:hypothetical protein